METAVRLPKWKRFSTRKSRLKLEGPVNSFLSVHVDTLVGRTIGVDEQLLDDEARWVRHEQLHVARDWDGVRPPVAFQAAAVERCQELRVEASVVLAEAIVSRGRRVISEEFLGEASVRQRRADITSQCLVGRKGQVGIACAQG
jgi:hypothetical protein